MNNKYLKKLKLKDKPYNFKQWKATPKIRKIKEKTGMDYRSVWNFDLTVAAYIYSHLKLYKDYTITDLYRTTFIYNGRTYSLSEGIDIVCEGLADYLSASITERTVETLKKYTDALHLFAEMAPYIWD